MNLALELVGKTLYLILYAVFALVYDALKFLIPSKYRSKNVDKEIVLITGSGSGLGKSLAKKLSKLGATLVLWDINDAANKQTLQEIVDDGGKAYAFQCDLSNKDEIYDCAKKTVSHVGNITMLVNNAGIVTGKKFLESSDAAIQKTFQVNLMAHFWLTKAFLPHMLETNHGHVVTVASMAGIVGTAGLCDYCASKFGAVGFDDALRNEIYRLGKSGVKTTVVCPFYINTGMFHGVETRLIPLLDQEYVTDKMLEAILTDQELLMLPRFMYWGAFVQRLLPVRVASYVSNEIFESCKSMDQFVGRQKTD